MSVRLVDNKDTLKKVNDWRDPLYLKNLLTDKEKLIHKKAKDFCKTRLLPTVIAATLSLIHISAPTSPY